MVPMEKSLGPYIKTSKVKWITYKFHVIKSMQFDIILRTASIIIFAHTFCALEILEYSSFLWVRDYQ